MISEIVLTCRWSYLPYILDSTPIHIMSDEFFMNNHAAGSSENTEKTYNRFSSRASVSFYGYVRLK